MRRVRLPETLLGTPISIWFDPDISEYEVRVRGNKAATYYTEDREDAFQTAHVMRNTIAYEKTLRNT